MIKPILFSLLTLTLSISSLQAQQPPAPRPVATTWPGIEFELVKVLRIPGDRLIVGVQLHATPQSPPLTLIGVELKPPAGASPEALASGAYRPRPFSIEGAVMTDEQTKQTYSTVKPDPAGPSYLPSTVLTSLRPGGTEIMSIEFPAPPPPPVGALTVQTVSILLPNAQAPLTGIVVPPPAAVQ